MSLEDSEQKIREHRLVAILRSDRSEELVPLCDALYESGIRIIEITMTVPKALETIAAVDKRIGPKILLGAGTVLDPETAEAVVKAGAKFVVSPVVDLETIHACHKLETLIMPGAMTPTEIGTAFKAGARIVKLFPASIGGPEYLKTLKGPFPQIALLPTGGIDLENMTEFLQAGACAVGVGSSLIQKTAVLNGDWDAVRGHAEKFVQKVQNIL